MHSFIGVVAGVLGLVQVVPYIWAIVRGTCRPSQITYGIWTLAHAVTLGSYIAAGATTTVWYVAAITLSGATVFALALWRGTRARDGVDVLCGLTAAIAIVLWLTVGPAAALYAALSTTALGFIPTMRKAWADPSSENTTSWAIAAAAAFLNACALTTLAPAIAALPLVTLACDATTLAILTRRQTARPQLSALAPALPLRHNPSSSEPS